MRGYRCRIGESATYERNQRVLLASGLNKVKPESFWARGISGSVGTRQNMLTTGT